MNKQESEKPLEKPTNKKNGGVAQSGQSNGFLLRASKVRILVPSPQYCRIRVKENDKNKI